MNKLLSLFQNKHQVDQSRARQQAVRYFDLSLLRQIFRFGLVGITAATIHFSIVVMLVQHYSFEPLIANIFAFMVSFQASYFGHRRFTFHGTTAMHIVAVPKLLTLQIMNFIANESMFYVLMALHLPYQLALIIVLATLPLFTFAVSKRWIFR